MKNFFENKRIVVTGGTGFLGYYVCQKLKERCCKQILVPTIDNYNLVKLEDVKRMYDDMRPDIVIHLAAVVGGIGANREHPGKFFYENLMMGVQLIDEARLRKLEKFVAIGTICAYPKYTPVPFKEEDLWNGYPEETNAPYGLAKKMLLVQSQAYRQEYGFNSIFLLPVNLYGPRDNFDPASSHVIPALIKKCVDAINNDEKYIECW
ncbi:MAG: NAD-dependent epimerase/dehydratase family protein, partial [Phycisphaerales bacterium]